MRAKYLKNCDISSVQGKFTNSPCWKAIMKVKEIYIVGRTVNVHSGDSAKVWKDSLSSLPP